VVGALGGIDAALEAAEGVLAADEGLAGTARANRSRANRSCSICVFVIHFTRSF